MENEREPKYIVFQSQAAQPQTSSQLHYLINSDGSITKVILQDEKENKEYSPSCECICIGYVGNVNSAGKVKNAPTRLQEAALFNKIIQLLERHPNVKVISDSTLTASKNPLGFNVEVWLANYVPQF